jgi:hypothetical protein
MNINLLVLCNFTPVKEIFQYSMLFLLISLVFGENRNPLLTCLLNVFSLLYS